MYKQSIVNQQSTKGVPTWSSSGHSICKDQRPKDEDSARLASILLGELCTNNTKYAYTIPGERLLWYTTSAIPTIFSVVQYVIVKAGKECCRRYNGTRGGVEKATIHHKAQPSAVLWLSRPLSKYHYITYSTTFPALTNLLWSMWGRQRCRPLPPKASDLICLGRHLLQERYMQGKGASCCCQKSLFYFGRGRSLLRQSNSRSQHAPCCCRRSRLCFGRGMRSLRQRNLAISMDCLENSSPDTAELCLPAKKDHD